MKVSEMRKYIISLIRDYEICDNNHHFFTEKEIKEMLPDEVKKVYDLCYANFGEYTPYHRPYPCEEVVF